MNSYDNDGDDPRWPDADQARAAEEAERSTLLGGVESEPEPAARARERTTRWHGGLDFGLLVLRLVLGATMLGHGLRKLLGVFGGAGIDGFAAALGSAFGFDSYTSVLAWITALTETLGGALLIVGMFTPLAAAGLLGVAASVVYVKFDGGFFGPPEGFEYELLLACCAFVLLFTGAGRVSIDVHTPWRRRPWPYGVLGVLAAAAGAVVILAIFR